MRLDTSVTVIFVVGIAVAAPLSLAAAFWILLRTRPKATLMEAAEALAMVITAVRRGARRRTSSATMPESDGRVRE